LGSAGEELVVGFERARLAEQGRGDLAREVRSVAAEDGDRRGLRCTLVVRCVGAGTVDRGEDDERFGADSLFLSRNERALSEERPEDWRLYRVRDVSKRPLISSNWLLHSTLARGVPAETWKVSFA
jgi:hypothetical protein